MVLSIIVISHNQKDKLQRCIDSILSQEISFDYEIIISDDASCDGTWELALKYSNDFDNIQAFQCNTDNYDPANHSMRSGWNRCNGYKYAKGKYIAHVDGDDFFLSGKKIYERQVKLLEDNPDCSCCMANLYKLKDGEPISDVVLGHDESFPTGYVLSSEDYIKSYFRESHCFVYRRNSTNNPVSYLGGFYVDSVITAHHLQFGPIICINDAGYVYVQYKNSIWVNNSSSKKHRMEYKIFSHALFIGALIPHWKFVYLRSRGYLKQIWDVVRLSLIKYEVRSDTLEWIRQFKLFLYGSFNRKLSLIDILRLFFLFLYLPLLIVFLPSAKWPYKLLLKLL